MLRKGGRGEGTFACVYVHACKILPHSLLADDIILSGRCHGNEQHHWLDLALGVS